MKLVVASNNAHKIEELRAILGELGFEVCSQKDAGLHIEPDENGTTFEENSYIKAKATLDACGFATVADDSGLMVDALGGAPGVHSARYGGEAYKSDRARLELLLRNMEEKENRKAHFVSVIALLLPDGRKIVARGECPGEILRAPQGENGFGYDPVFYIPEAGCTFAQMPAEKKNEISHRARALRLLAEKIRKGQWDVDE